MTQEEISKIRRYYYRFGYSQDHLARKFNVPKRKITEVLHTDVEQIGIACTVELLKTN